MSLLILFIDGVGIGADDPETNPFAEIGARRLAPLRGRAPEPGCAFRPLDATLGVPGLPQSATGQTTLYSGVNAAGVMGRHVQGLPGPTLRKLLERDSLFLRLVRSGRRPTFANLYTRGHLEAERPRWSATTRMVHYAGVSFRVLGHDGTRDAALFHDWTGEWGARHGIEIPRRTADDAAAVLAGLLDDHDLVLYEYFLTDVAGHRGSRDEKRRQAVRAETLVDAVLRREEGSGHTVLVVSDHGNLEEAHHRRHTLNPVPLLGWGPRATPLVGAIDAMTAFTPVIANED